MVSFVMYRIQNKKGTEKFQKKADESILENLRTKYAPITMSFPGCVKVKKCNFGNCYQSTQTAFELWQMINRTSIHFYEFKVEMVDILSGNGSMVDSLMKGTRNVKRACWIC